MKSSCCLPGETLIKLENKGGAFISDIKEGREVLAHNNNKYKVLSTLKKMYTGPLYILNIKGMEHLLRLTEEHAVGVSISLKTNEITWKAACYMKPGDLVLRPYGDQIPDPKSEYPRHKYGTLHPVESVTIEQATNKPVYNFEVETVHSFIANDCAVHDC